VFLAPVLLPVLVAASQGCNGDALTTTPDAGPPPGGLTPEQAAQVVARIGDKTVTLGDFAAALERMDQYDRLRYQTKERRRELLSEIVDVELLADEARRRGLDKEPEVEEAIRQILRDAILAKVRDTLPTPAEIPADEVKAYYEANADKFTEPERRRVSAIVLDDRATADKALEEAKAVTTTFQWGEIFARHSLNSPVRKPGATQATIEMLGDLGVVGPLSDPKGGNVRVPMPVRAAVFTLAKAGDVHPTAIESEGKWFVIRLTSITPGHKRTMAEAERSIRVALLQQRLEEKEKALEADLRKRYPVAVDEAVLGTVRAPKLPDATSGASPWVRGSAWPEASGGSSAAPPGSLAPPGSSAAAAGSAASPASATPSARPKR
jgi:peptidyl-prolyl cis-trans isomerase C